MGERECGYSCQLYPKHGKNARYAKTPKQTIYNESNRAVKRSYQFK